MSRWALWIYHALITNEVGQGAGAISVTLTQAAGDQLEILHGQVTNGDTSSRTAQVLITDGTAGQEISALESLSLGAGGGVGFPHANAAGTFETGPTQFSVAGDMDIIMSLAAVADGQDATFGIACLIRGRPPTVVTAGAGTEAVTELTNRVV